MSRKTLDASGVREALEARTQHYLGRSADELLGADPEELPHIAAIPHLFALAGEASVPGAARPTLLVRPTGDEVLEQYCAVVDGMLRTFCDGTSVVGERLTGPTGQLVLFADRDPIDLAGSSGPLWLSVTEYVRVVARDGGYGVDVEGYMYTLSVDPQHADPHAIWHWHPARERDPHLHDKLLLSTGRTPARLPSGWVSLAAVARFIVLQLGVPGRRNDVEAELDRLESRLVGVSPWSVSRSAT